jgi:small GTP-binding protein
MDKIISERIKEWQDQLEIAIGSIQQLSRHVHNERILDEVRQLEKAVQEPFLFVVVGEVKSGKSSFINALLQAKDPIVEVAPSPKTDKINQLLYDEDERQVDVNAYFRKIYIDKPILEEISIVDTPGTNTIIQHHQEITERFIPIADLIVFVLEAKNPYRQSIWDFFDLLKENWRKKIVFVLQQKDLMEEEDLQHNLQGLKDHLKEKNIDHPVIFSTSAKWELEDKTSSGFPDLRTWINENITGGASAVLKLSSLINTSEIILDAIDKGLDDREKQYESDQAFRNKVSEKIRSEQEQARKDVELLTENISNSYTNVCKEYEQEIRSTLSFWGLLKRSIASIFSKQAKLKEWANQFHQNLSKDLDEALQSKIESGVQGISKRIVDLSEWVDVQIRTSNTILTNDHQVFAHIAEKRKSIIASVEEEFRALIESSNIALQPVDKDISTALPSTVATGSGLAVVGVVMAAITKMMVFDITGGVLTGVGLLLAGISSGYSRSKVLKSFRSETEKGADKIEAKTEEVLSKYIDQITVQMDSAFQKLDEHLENEEATIRKMRSESESIRDQLDNIQSEIEDKKA